MLEMVQVRVKGSAPVRQILGNCKIRQLGHLPPFTLVVTLPLEDPRLAELLRYDLSRDELVVSQTLVHRRYSASEISDARFFVALRARWESPEYLVPDVPGGRDLEADWRAFDRSARPLDYALDARAMRRDVLHIDNGFTLVSDRVRHLLEDVCPDDVAFHEVRPVAATKERSYSLKASPAGRELLAKFKESGLTADRLYSWVDDSVQRELRDRWYAEVDRMIDKRDVRPRRFPHSFWRLSASYVDAQIDTTATLVGTYLHKRVLGYERTDEWPDQTADSLGHRLLSRVAVTQASVVERDVQMTAERIGAIDGPGQAHRLLIVSPRLVAALTKAHVVGFVFEPLVLL